VIPGNGFICLDVGGMCCNTSDVARAQGMVTWTSALSDDSTIVHGLVPDGVEEVVLTATDGTTKTAWLRTTCTAQRWKESSPRCVSPVRREPSSSGRGAERTAARLPSGSGNEKESPQQACLLRWANTSSRRPLGDLQRTDVLRLQ
jgi:hypothetical protein